MGRKKQEGNYFFPVDVGFFSDRKIKILKARYGTDGLTIYLYLLCEIYKTGYYMQIDEDIEFIISDAKTETDIDDLMQEGYLGMCNAVDHYDLSAGVPFHSYASLWIRQGVRRYSQDNRHKVYDELAKYHCTKQSVWV